jgi:hypothetical protein
MQASSWSHLAQTSLSQSSWHSAKSAQDMSWISGSNSDIEGMLLSVSVGGGLLVTEQSTPHGQMPDAPRVKNMSFKASSSPRIEHRLIFTIIGGSSRSRIRETPSVAILSSMNIVRSRSRVSRLKPPSSFFTHVVLMLVACVNACAHGWGQER